MSEIHPNDRRAAAGLLPMPPLGVVPRKFFLEGRLSEINSAIQRYLVANYIIPQEWLDERNELLQSLSLGDSRVKDWALCLGTPEEVHKHCPTKIVPHMEHQFLVDRTVSVGHVCPTKHYVGDTVPSGTLCGSIYGSGVTADRSEVDCLICARLMEAYKL